MSDDQQAPLPVVMSIAGLDLTGGAGLQADGEAIVSMGCHACPVITAATVQDTVRVAGFAPIAPEVVIAQARAVLEDMPVHAIKIGLLGSLENIEAVHGVLADYPGIPVVLDPLLASGAGDELADEEMIEAMRELLLPQTTVLTPNSQEARRLAPQSDNLEACAMSLLEQGCDFVLVTGTHENTPQVINTLYGGNRRLEQYRWERLEGSYHGSGCTLSAALAALLAQGEAVPGAVREAQEYTWQALYHGYALGMGQHLPNRLFWATAADEETDEGEDGDAAD